MHTANRSTYRLICWMIMAVCVTHATIAQAWVLTIAQNKATDHHRTRARGPVPVAEVEPTATAAAPALPDDEVWDAVRSLPPRQRAAILLRYAGDLSHREVGTVLGCSEEAARRSAHEGLKRLRQEVPAP